MKNELGDPLLQFCPPMLFVRGVHHFNVTVSLSPFSRVLVPAMCKSPTQHKHNIDFFLFISKIKNSKHQQGAHWAVQLVPHLPAKARMCKLHLILAIFLNYFILCSRVWRFQQHFFQWENNSFNLLTCLTGSFRARQTCNVGTHHF